MVVHRTSTNSRYLFRLSLAMVVGEAVVYGFTRKKYTDVLYGCVVLINVFRGTWAQVYIFVRYPNRWMNTVLAFCVGTDHTLFPSLGPVLCCS